MKMNSLVAPKPWHRRMIKIDEAVKAKVEKLLNL
jgi:hypothetical protein